MRGARRGVLAALAIASLCLTTSALAATGHTGAKLTVRPAVGFQRTPFVISFTAQRTGFVPSIFTGYAVVASARGSRGCMSTASVTVPATWQGQRVHVTLRPGRASARWCKGTYAGRLEEMVRPTCGFREMCPLARPASPALIGYLTIDRFSFRVR